MRAASAIQWGWRPASCTTWRSMPAPSARSIDSADPRANSSEATISDTTSDAPNRWAMRRSPASVTPDIGASATQPSKATGPIERA